MSYVNATLDSSTNQLSIIPLNKFSNKGKKWDKKKALADRVSTLYGKSDDKYRQYKIEQCSTFIDYLIDPDIDELQFLSKLQSRYLCRQRFCPVCQWRRVLKWQMRMEKMTHQLENNYPDLRYIFLTLTVRNCEIKDLRATIQKMNYGWRKMVARKRFPAIGWLKATELTKPNNDPSNNLVHPHFHIVMGVRPSYFSHGYIKKQEWADMWRQSLGLDYDPIIDIRKAYKEDKQDRINSIQGNHPLSRALREALKYAIKDKHLTVDHKWLSVITSQLHNSRAISVGGIFKEYLSEKDINDPGLLDENHPEGLCMRFSWRTYQELQKTQELQKA